MKRALRVFLLGGDLGGWALDTELRLARQALGSIPGIELTDDPRTAEVLHTVWPEQLLEKPELRGLWVGKTVVASFSNDPLALFERVPGLYDAARDWICVAQSSLAAAELRSLGLPRVEQVPYRMEEGPFFPIRSDDPLVRVRKTKLGIKDGAYVVGFFQRDSEGSDLSRIKVQKAPDFFAALMKEVSALHPRLHVLLAGPRRHWIRGELSRLGVNYSFHGEVTTTDDYLHGVIPKEEMNLLVNCCDLNIVTSRWEGAPRAIMESVAAERKVISTRVGVAPDLLEHFCLFDDLPAAVKILEKELRESHLAVSVPVQKRRLEEKHGLRSATQAWKEIYAHLAENPYPVRGANTAVKAGKAAKLLRMVRKRIPLALLRPRGRLAWFKEEGAPASELDAALERALREEKLLVNDSAEASVLLIDGVPGYAAEQAVKRFRGTHVLHRYTGPGVDPAKFYAWNREHATHTLFSTTHDWIAAGQGPVRPRIVRNSLFLPQALPPSSRPLRVGVIGTAASLARWRREGLSPEDSEPAQGWDAIILLEDGSEARLAALRAAYHRRPTLYPARSGVAEISGFAGLAYQDASEIPARRQELLAFAEGLRRCALVPERGETLLRYLVGEGDLL